jgi:DNA-binding response OmpR family regulator
MRLTAQGVKEQRQSSPNQDSSRRAESRPVSAQNRRLKICFLEDSCTSSHAVREALGERGYEVDHFSAAEEAFDALAEKNYDAVLASQIVSLGGMDCESLIRKLRHSATAEKRALPVIAITANADPTNAE